MGVSTNTFYGDIANSFTATASFATNNQSRLIYGPPMRGGGHTRGLYLFQTTGTYRWIEDQPAPIGTTSPTTFKHLGI
jgi:hypothetical protein